VRVTPIPDGEIWAGASRIVMGPPAGNDPTGEIRACEMVAELHRGRPAYSARCVLEDGDLETLQAGGVVWLTFYGAVAPFSVTVAPVAPEPPAESRDTETRIRACEPPGLAVMVDGERVPIQPPDMLGQLSRVDLVVEETVSGQDAARVRVLTGVPSHRPSAPCPIQNASVHQVPLATVSVARHQSVIQDCHITPTPGEVPGA